MKKLFFCFFIHGNIFAMQLEEDYVKVDVGDFSDSAWSDTSSEHNEFVNPKDFISVVDKRFSFVAFNFLENLKKELSVTAIDQAKASNFFSLVSVQVNNLMQRGSKQFFEEIEKLNVSNEQFIDLIEIRIEKFNTTLRQFKQILNNKIIELQKENQKKIIEEAKRTCLHDFFVMFNECLKKYFCAC